MKFHFFSTEHIAFEPWDYLSPMSPGIGGSETAQVECAWRLARRGHEVICYAPLRPGTSPSWRGTEWRHSRDADFTEDGCWILSRCPEILDYFGARRESQPRWLVCQDVEYPELTTKRGDKLDLVLTLCDTQAKFLGSHYPFVSDRVVVSSNGIRSDEIRALYKRQPPIKRNPRRMIWTSSPDRGLECLLDIYRRVREFVPDVELKIYYGWDNIDKIIEREPGTFWRDVKARVVKALGQPGITWGGRVSQKQLYDEYMQAGLWVYPTEFAETSCINCMDAQACGAVPVTNPFWALGQNVRHGVFIEGQPWQDALTRARYALEIVRLMANPADQDILRRDMALDSLMTQNWERVVDQYEGKMLGFGERGFGYQYAFQLKHATGTVINIGANNDAPRFGEQPGCLNVDLYDVDPYTKLPNAKHLHADARQLPQETWGKFDTAVLGDILEHCHDLDIVTMINNAKRTTKPGGRVVVTFPSDDRAEFLHDEARHTNVDYASGIKAHHYRVLTPEHFEKLVKETGLRIQHQAYIDYGVCGGQGYVLA